MHRHIHDVATAPVVTDEVDGAIDVLQRVFEPITVSHVGRREVVWQR